MPYLLIIINISLMSIGQLFFKQSAVFVNAHIDLNLITRYLFNPWFYGAITFFGEKMNAVNIIGMFSLCWALAWFQLNNF